MTIAFRADASAHIGVGHVMRCLTLANAMAGRGLKTKFICRYLPQYLESILIANGHQVLRLENAPNGDGLDGLPQSKLLGVSQHQDANETIEALKNEKLDWIIIDHYGIDARWETSLRSKASRIMAIDDTADRIHDCDVLLDQNYYLNADTRYVGKVPTTCILLLGPRYALLRDEFREWRAKIKPRSGVVKRVLVFFGGMDADNHTSRAIEVLRQICGTEIAVDVVIGAAHSQREHIESQCLKYSFHCHVETSRMAELMANADLSIGAGGSATWERCSLGLPSLVVPIASNQIEITSALDSFGACQNIDSQNVVSEIAIRHAIIEILRNPDRLHAMSIKSFSLVDGLGVKQLCRVLGY